VVSPSGPVDRGDLELGVSLLEKRGYRVCVASHAADQHGSSGVSYLAGSDQDRAADINSCFADADIDAIFCSRGGYGSLRLLDHLDWDVIRDNPKIFVGYSDITSLHLGIARHAGFVTFHAPMVCAYPKLNDTAMAQLWSLLEGDGGPELPLLEHQDTRTSAIQTLVPGIATGELAGGCLCLLAHACGSKYAPDLSGKIVLIEDVGEAVYRADRSLWQLRNAGVLDDVAGFVVGNLTNWRQQEADPPRNTPEMMFGEFFGELGKPAIMGYPFGHEPNPVSLPLGVTARLDAGSGSLTLIGPWAVC